MDDVVADWMGYARKYLKTEWQQGEMVPEKQWNRLKDDQRMYSKLDLKEGAIELVDWCKAYQQKTGCGLFFLTAVPHNNDMPFSFHDKVEWAQKYFPGIPVFFGPYSHDKWIRCTSPDDLLIDDRRSNNDEWKRQGGRAFLYKNWPECKLWLEAHLGVL
jgi:5'(3')-deoxyribonucleotidase